MYKGLKIIRANIFVCLIFNTKVMEIFFDDCSLVVTSLSVRVSLSRLFIGSRPILFEAITFDPLSVEVTQPSMSSDRT